MQNMFAKSMFQSKVLLFSEHGHIFEKYPRILTKLEKIIVITS